ncbi:MAG TPA: MFS transporter [Egibacteraceae bacterium]|nr:MFS transporter [Egibacteraceae bacterium]
MPSSLRSERAALSTVFALFGVSIGSWISRIPAVTESLGLSKGQLSAVFIAGTIGMLGALYPTSKVIARIGSRSVVLPAASVLLASVALLGVAPSRPWLAAGMFCVGAAGATLNVAINAQGVAVEQLCGRPVMPTFHAGYSFGAMGGAAIGGLAAAAGVGPAAHFPTVAAVLAAVCVVAARFLLDTPRVQAPPRAVAVWRSPGLLLVAAIAFLSFLSERAAGDWSALFMRESIGTSEALAAGAYTAFGLAMGTGRLLGGRMVALLGRRGVVRWGGMLAAAGLTLPLLAPSPLAGIIGLGVFGLGLASMVPVAMSAAGNLPDVPAEQGVAGVVVAGWSASLVGPPLLGNLADLTSLPAALSLVVIAALCLSLLGGRIPIARKTDAPPPALVG